MNFAIIGCGLIGRKRLRALKDHRLIVAADVCLERAEALAAQRPGAAATTDWHAAVMRPDVAAVVVATTNDCLAPVTLAAVRAGKHVLVEKPAARSVEEILPVIAAARSGVCVQVGFNHRYHAGIRKAREIFESGALGPLMFIRARYGHGGRVGYDREWRAHPEIAGGGEILDQGVHLIDLSRWFLGEFTHTRGYAHTYFWDMPVEDNGFITLQTAQQQTAWLHVSCTEWKNLFSFEIYGREGKLAIDGLGGSYGVERLSYYKMLPQMGPPETTVWEYPGEDLSWEKETADFLAAIQHGKPLTAGLQDARAVLGIVDTIYKDSRV